MKTLTMRLSLVVAFGCLSFLYAQYVRRHAIIEDVAGVQTEASVLDFRSEELRKFHHSDLRVHFLSDQFFEVAIPFENLDSIKAKNEGVEVTYFWLGQEKKLSGKLATGEFTGKNDFGDFNISSDKLRRLIFKDVVSRWVKTPRKKKAMSYMAILLLTDNRNVRVDDLRRHDRYYSTEGYIVGGSTRYGHYNDFRFLKGESIVTVEFDNLESIEFSPALDTVTVTLKNGKSASGKLSQANEAGVDGFTGIYDNGEFFISPRYIKAIEFNQSKKSE